MPAFGDPPIESRAPLGPHAPLYMMPADDWSLIKYGPIFVEERKLASELHKRATGNTLYVLDEPTTGLHFEDIRKLLQVLQRLVSTGNTVLVIEHNLDVIKTADWIIDLGPEGGDAGGMVIVEGSPEVVAKTSDSHTGRFLAPLLGDRAG